jgi:predicted esterase
MFAPVVLCAVLLSGIEAPNDLWQRYQSAQRHTPRHTEHQQSAVKIGDKTMRYAAFTIGEAPAHGYPLYIALHGGGSAPPSLNDSQWDHMKRYYRDSVQQGVYVAPRGISDTWDLHFQPASYALMERLIENMVLFENVDPDRVYLTGFSAGGDGVYQLTPRLADRLAAANMSAGHPNGVNFVNLASTPFCVQVGERDSAYNRNHVTAETNDKLDKLADSNPGFYEHQAFVHKGRPHNFADNDPGQNSYLVMDSPHKWLIDNDTSAHGANTNAVAWLNQYTRNPLPERVVWDLTTRAQRQTSGQWYWLDIGNETAETLGTDTIVASYDPVLNMVIVDQAKKSLRVLLNDQMLDLDETVHVLVNDQHIDVPVKRSEAMQEATLEQRTDPRWIFSAAIDLVEDAQGWHVVKQP